MPKLGLGLSLSKVPSSGGGGFNPNSIAGLGLWLKADAGVSYNGSNHITQWVDQSPSALTFVPDSVSSDITYNSSFINSKPAIIFAFGASGVNGLYNTSVFEMKSIFAAIQPNGNNFEYASVCENNGLAIYSTLSYYGVPWGSYLNNNTPALTTLSLDTPYILSGRSTDGTDQTFYLNNVDDTATSGSGFYNSRTEIVIGNGGARSFFAQAFEGAIMEVIAYSTYLTPSDMTDVYTYLNDKYAIV